MVMTKQELQTKLDTIVANHTSQVKIRNDAQVLINKLEGAYEIVKEMVDNFEEKKEEKDAASTRSKSN